MIPVIIKHEDGRISEVTSPLVLTKAVTSAGQAGYKVQGKLSINTDFSHYDGYKDAVPTNVFNVHNNLIIVRQIPDSTTNNIVKIINLTSGYCFSEYVNVNDKIVEETVGDFSFITDLQKTFMYVPHIYSERVHCPSSLYDAQNRWSPLETQIVGKKLNNELLIFVVLKNSNKIIAHFDFSTKNWVFWDYIKTKWDDFDSYHYSVNQEHAIPLENITACYINSKLHFRVIGTLIVYNTAGKKTLI